MLNAIDASELYVGTNTTFLGPVVLEACITTAASVVFRGPVYGRCGAVRVPAGSVLRLDVTFNQTLQTPIWVDRGGTLTVQGEGSATFAGGITNYGSVVVNCTSATFQSPVGTTNLLGSGPVWCQTDSSFSIASGFQCSWR